MKINKINITLDVIGKRDDGYHDLQMIMQSVNLYDNIFLKKTKEPGIRLSTNLPWLPTDERNLAYTAAKTLLEQYDVKQGVSIELTKSIPVSAGLAGGSTDCAGVLIGIRSLFRLPISNSRLMQIGKELGADVPYCIMRGTVLAEGIGEKLTRLPPFPNCYLVLAKPPISVSTASIFKAYNSEKVQAHPDTEKMISLIKNNDLNGICSNLCNVLESVTIEQHPIIADIKEAMLKSNALGALMSGSGPTVFGIFRTHREAVEALKYIRKEFKLKDVFLTTIFNT